MKIVHEIRGPMQVVAGCTAYARKDDAEKSEGFRTEVLLVPDPNFEQPWGDYSEAIYIEGDGALVLRALKEAVSQLEATGEVLVVDGLLDAEWQRRPERYMRPRRARKKGVPTDGA